MKRAFILGFISCLIFLLSLERSLSQRGQSVVMVRNERGQFAPFYFGSYALLIGISDYTRG